MNTCCKNQTSPYCPVCGANLKANSLAGLVEELEKRLETAYALQNSWKERPGNEAESQKKKVARAIARTQRRIEQLSSWIKQLNEPGEATQSTHRMD